VSPYTTPATSVSLVGKFVSSAITRQFTATPSAVSAERQLAASATINNFLQVSFFIPDLLALIFVFRHHRTKKLLSHFPSLTVHSSFSGRGALLLLREQINGFH
jgi:hypothetical protein